MIQDNLLEKVLLEFAEIIQELSEAIDTISYLKDENKRLNEFMVSIQHPILHKK